MATTKCSHKLKNQLVNAFESDFAEEINNDYAGFNNKTIQKILTYSHDNYGEVTPLKLEEAEQVSQQEFTIDKLFGIFARQTEDVMNVTEAEKYPCAPAQIVQKSLNIIIKAQILPEASFHE